MSNFGLYGPVGWIFVVLAILTPVFLLWLLSPNPRWWSDPIVWLIDKLP